MTKQKSTKRALFSSVLVMLLCFAMLLGTTFAWFTDSVTSGKNQIVAGNLDIEVQYSKDAKDWKDVEGATDLFDPNALWEPGHTEVVYLKLTNKGSLALKSNLTVTINNEVAGTNVKGKPFKLSDVLVFSAIEEWDGETKYADREAAIAAIKDTAKLGTYSKYISPLEVGKSVAIAMVVYMPETVGNEANYKTGTTPPSIDLGISVYATQKTFEKDSFGSDYDADAAWIGNISDPEPDEYTNGAGTVIYKVSNGAELAWVAEYVNSGAAAKAWKANQMSVVLTKDIDLNNVPWTPIGTDDQPFIWSFDGNGHTITNLKVDVDEAAGLFGFAELNEIKNVTISGANVSSNHWAAALLGHGLCETITNCHVNDATIICTPELVDDKYDNGDKAGAIFGYNSAEPNAPITGCSAKNVTIYAYRDLGGIGGCFSSYNTGNDTVDCTVENITLNYVAAPGAMAGNKKNENAKLVIGRTDVEITGNDVVTPKKANFVSTAAELSALSDQKLEGTVILSDDIDMGGKAIKSLASAYDKELTVEGNGHKISNVVIDAGSHNGMDNYGLFYAYTGSTLTINDLKIENAKVEASKSNYGAAIVVGYSDGGSVINLNNVDVYNSTVVNGYDEAAIYVSYTTNVVNLTNCDSVGCSVQGETATKTGAFIGHLNGGTATLTNCTTDLTIGVCNRNNGNIIVK